MMPLLFADVMPVLAAKVVKIPTLDTQFRSMLYQFMKWMNIPKEYAAMTEWGLRLGVAFLIFLIFAVLARRSRIRAIVDWIDNKVGIIELTPADRSFFAFLAWLVLWLPGVLLILYTLRLVGLLATLGLSAGAVAAIAAAANRDLLGNVFAGFTLQARRHISVADAVKIKDVTGEVLNIGLTASAIEDFDGVVHYIPNAKILNETLTNYSLAQFRRVEIAFYFDVDEVDVTEVEEILQEIIDEAEGQKAGKEGFFRYGVLNEKGQEVKLYLYMEPKGWTANASAARRLLLDKIDDSAVQVGIPQQMVVPIEEDDETTN